MTNDHNTSFRKDESSFENKTSSRQTPDFIEFDDTQEYIHHSSDWNNPEQEELAQLQKVSFSPSVRVGSFICCFIAAILSIGLLSTFLFVFCLATLFLYRSIPFNGMARVLWSLFTNCLVVTLGLAISVFSPVLGFSLIVINFSLSGNQDNQDFARRSYRRFF